MRTPAQWLRRVRRRKPGVYAYRTDRHQKAGREWGYVGESLHLSLRALCHEGRCHHQGCPPKPWLDLRPRRFVLIRLPWWLGFSWITRSLETLVIQTLRPRYNWAKNTRADKVGPRSQHAQRWLRNEIKRMN